MFDINCSNLWLNRLHNDGNKSQRPGVASYLRPQTADKMEIRFGKPLWENRGELVAGRQAPNGEKRIEMKSENLRPLYEMKDNPYLVTA